MLHSPGGGHQSEDTHGETYCQWGCDGGLQTLPLLSPSPPSPCMGRQPALSFPLFCQLEGIQHLSPVSGWASVTPASSGLCRPVFIFCLLPPPDFLSLSFALLSGSRYGFNHYSYCPLLMFIHHPFLTMFISLLSLSIPLHFNLNTHTYFTR